MSNESTCRVVRQYGRRVDLDDIKKATLSAVSEWPRQRDRLPAHRADLLAAAWHAGNRNVAELARAAGSARDTVYADLRSRGIYPTGRDMPLIDGPRYIPLRQETANQLAAAMNAALLPTQLTDSPGPLTGAAWMLAKAMTRIADLAGPEDRKRLAELAGPEAVTPADDPASPENAEDLADSLRMALAEAHAYWASLQSAPELGARAVDRAVSRVTDEVNVGTTTMDVLLPNTTSITVTLGEVPYTQPGEGFTTVVTDSAFLRTDNISGRDHLEIRAALETIGEVLSRHLTEDAYDEA